MEQITNWVILTLMGSYMFEYDSQAYFKQNLVYVPELGASISACNLLAVDGSCHTHFSRVTLSLPFLNPKDLSISQGDPTLH